MEATLTCQKPARCALHPRFVIAAARRGFGRMLRKLHLKRPICNKCGDDKLIYWYLDPNGWACHMHRGERGYYLER